jgi:hypothetical protein
MFPSSFRDSEKTRMAKSSFTNGISRMTECSIGQIQRRASWSTSIPTDNIVPSSLFMTTQAQLA